MTGYGHVKSQYGDKEITVEIRCLNSKINDFRLKLPNAYKQKELELRKLLNESVVRGKLDVVISVVSSKGDNEFSLNKKLFKSFYDQIQDLGIDLGKTDILNAILQFPNVIESHETDLDEEEFEFVLAKGNLERFEHRTATKLEEIEENVDHPMNRREKDRLDFESKDLLTKEFR